MMVRSTIRRLLSSYDRRKRSVLDATIASPPEMGPAEVNSPDPAPSNMRPTVPQDSDGQPAHDRDVSMAKSTLRLEKPCARMIWIKQR